MPLWYVVGMFLAIGLLASCVANNSSHFDAAVQEGNVVILQPSGIKVQFLEEAERKIFNHL
jgi:hypothetical protein